MYKLSFYIPTENKEEVKTALFNMGIGKYNNYDSCSFESLGQGQFRSINDAKPHIGSLNKIEEVFKLEDF